MGWIGCVHCEKFQSDFVAWTFAPVLPVLHRIRQPNSPKCAQVEQNARKQEFRVQLVGLGSTNFCTCRPILHWVFVSQPNCSKCSKISMKHTRTWVLGPMGWIGCVRCEKFKCDFVARTFAPVLPILHRVRQTNSPKCTQIEQNTRKQEF